MLKLPRPMSNEAMERLEEMLPAIDKALSQIQQLVDNGTIKGEITINNLKPLRKTYNAFWDAVEDR